MKINMQFPNLIEGEPPFGAISPEDLFWDHTLITNEQEKYSIEQHCLAHWHLALIDYDEQFKCWIWHSLADLQRQYTWRKAIADRFPLLPNTSKRSQEQELTTAIVAVLEHHGMAVDTEVTCDAGIADIVTKMKDSVIEVKIRLTRSAMFSAVGQVLLYRSCINPDAQAIIIGHATSETASLLPYINKLGIKVIEWKD